MLDWLWGPEPLIAIQQFFGPAWELIFRSITLLGGVEGLALIIAVTLWISGRRLAYQLLAVVLFAALVDSMLWPLFDAPRPSEPGVIVHDHPLVPSFPSGHTVSAIALWGWLALRRHLPWLVPLLLVPAVMLSRLYLGVHYPGDVLCSVPLGLVLLGLFAVFWAPVSRLGARVRWRWWLFPALLAPLLALLLLGFTARGWTIFGALLGAGSGLLLEHRYLCYAPKRSAIERCGQLALGLSVLGLLLLAYELVGQPVLDALLLTFAALWMTFLAPLIMLRLGLGKHDTVAGDTFVLPEP
jgi:membrane-associated phospholipid phosphatase